MTKLYDDSEVTPRFVLDLVKAASAGAKRVADRYDLEFIAGADPRAVQGGTVSEEAASWRLKAGELRAIAAQMVMLIG
jgi:hypothetical protein